MSLHHHKNHHHHQQQQNPHFSSCCCCNTCNCFNCNCCSSSSNPNSTNSQSQISDQLLQTLTTHLLLQSQQPQILLKPYSHHNSRRRHNPRNEPIEDDQEQSLIQSLLHRVAALESSLSNLSSSRLERQQRFSSQKHSMKQLAAMTIQHHFRGYLARRSRTLRDLKRLASIKSHAASLRSLVSEKSLKDPRAVSKEAMDLLFQLDSIQSSDVVIREGKRAISKELVRISEFIDKVLIRESEDEVDGLIWRRGRGGPRVSFVEKENEGKVFDDLLERSSDEEEEEEEKTYLRNRRFYNRFSDGEESPKDRLNGVNGSPGLAAPLPVKMESRRKGSMKKVVIEKDYH